MILIMKTINCGISHGVCANEHEKTLGVFHIFTGLYLVVGFNPSDMEK